MPNATKRRTPTPDEIWNTNTRQMNDNMKRGEHPELDAAGNVVYQPVNTRTLLEIRAQLWKEREADRSRLAPQPADASTAGAKSPAPSAQPARPDVGPK